MDRRSWLVGMAPALGAWTMPGGNYAWAAAPSLSASPASGPSPAVHVAPGRVLRFPRDFGAHPEFRTEWWYLTGSLQAGGTVGASNEPPRVLGFQITFFRARVDVAAGNASRFAARQLIFAHAALTDLAAGQLLHDQRIARAGFGRADASLDDTRVLLGGWSLRREGPPSQSQYRSRIDAQGFALDLRFSQTQPLLLQGDRGYSRKGPNAAQASYYYSLPQLAVHGLVRHEGRTLAVQGKAWLDHEWSESVLDANAVGWDWIGMNLHDGSALTAFRLRRRDGSTLWSGGSLRAPGQPSRTLAHGEARFIPGRSWQSPATGARYPVEWKVDIAGASYTVRALLDAQELGSRQSIGGVYWEGLSELLDAKGRVIGGGYLEMTGYAGAMTM